MGSLGDQDQTERYAGVGFEPPAAMAAAANVTADAYARAEADRLGFWAEQAGRLDWAEPFTRVLDWSNAPFAKWFVGGRLNVAYNCVDRHVAAGRGDQVAIHFVGEPGDTRDVTYAQLKDEVSRAANAIEALGVQPGDRVAIYLPMIPEAIVAMLACARIGAPHTVVFGGFSAEALASRIEDCNARLVITADGGYRRGASSALKPAVDEAVAKLGEASPVENVVVVRRTGQEVAWNRDRDLWWHEVVDEASKIHEPQPFEAEHPLFVMYSSGTTGKPKGILHTTGGYLVGTAYTHHAVFDLKPARDVYWCTADVGWITGHSYIVYGPLANGATQVLYEGTPDTPDKGRWWEIIEKYQVTLFYTAPTAIRTFMKWGRQLPDRFDLTSLRLLGSVGEPINPAAYLWYREVIGGGRCPIVDTWWQTETGQMMISPLPGVSAGKPGSAMTALPGVGAEVVDESGRPVPNGSSGYLVLTEPWPAMLRTLWGDDERFVDTYWSRFADQGYYFAGDGARKDEDGSIWLLGRVDDVMNVSGHRLSTAEIESALVSHPRVAEAAVVGAADETTGQAVVAYVILRDGVEGAAQGDDLTLDLRNHVAKRIGAIAKPRRVTIVPELPKTRSGKIMRRLLRDLAEHRSIGDTTTLSDAGIMNLISSRASGSADEQHESTASTRIRAGGSAWQLSSAAVRLHPQARSTLLGTAAPEQPTVDAQVEFDVEELRREARESAAVSVGPDEQVAHVVDVDANGVPCRLYRPAPEAPVLVYVHGGAFLAGDLETHDVVCRRLANRSGWAVFAIDYGLAPERPYPAGLDDVERAVRWLLAEGAGSLGVDTRTLSIAGDSAGANLVAAATIRARDAGGPHYLLQVLVYPFLDLLGELPSRTELGADFGLTDEMLHWATGLYISDPAYRERPDASPLRALSLAGLPPAVVITAEFDPLRDEGEEYAAALANAGVPVVATRYLGMLHGFWGDPAQFDAARQAIDQAATALRNLISG